MSGSTPTLIAAPPGLAAHFGDVRSTTESLAEPLAPEDQVVQSMPDASPTKWHRAHTTWFFETFVLAPHEPGYRPVNEAYGYLFNSYYEQVGPRHPRPERGLISRPTVGEVGEYRAEVDGRVRCLIDRLDDSDALAAVEPTVTLGLHHEQQHQELLLMDIKHVFSRNPIRPAYRPKSCQGGSTSGPVTPAGWVALDGGIVELGHDGEGFAFDNEGPRHRAVIEPFRIADRLVTCGEWRAFIDDGGYQRPELWLSDGWITAQTEEWDGPLYWERHDDEWLVFTLAGLRPVDDAEPVCHVSFLEADAFARWAGARLPSEGEWELAATMAAADDPVNDLEQGRLHPAPAARGMSGAGVRQLGGEVWEWTASPYGPYPRYQPARGAIGEYNGKFMCNQMVLRGGACVTPPGHSRPTYRNFFPPAARWAFSGLRLAAGQ